ncbi:hypothetical protein BpJC7_19150 [Weizmannia acidilactici]|uniref:Uncharacterized protein n=1 Tax=Weizmannia acidilactici TaxID=2607726 RepID=A0A5J4J6R2_9BACI|nr:hypothetical protein [Weizmannia acidilactici]GER66730.1 hypothetical protein BpJC4_12010 [Weizmannia acidilactici]GER70612.1 hypothetical protein BpJC7_19150 [Weizmannia acidilactici]GER73785.1 hypothetical protein BpPP18_18520 [Weizmannia acidilactici]
MTNEQIADTFEYFGLGQLYQHLRTPIELSGILDSFSRQDLEAFLEVYDFSSYRQLLFDEFRYFFLTYQKGFIR